MAAESEIEVEALGHRDQETERKEKALERMSSLNSSHIGQSQPGNNGSPQEKQPQALQRASNTSHLVQQSQSSSPLQDFRRNGDPQRGSDVETAAAVATQDNLSSEKRQRRAQEAESSEPDDKLQQMQSSIQTADEIATPTTDAAPPQSASQDGSATYLANAMEAVDILLQSANQQTAALGLSTLLTILKVQHFQSHARGIRTFLWFLSQYETVRMYPVP